MSSRNYDRIPDELKAIPQWVAFALVNRGGKMTKLPIDPKNGRLASTTDPKTWGTFEQALRASKQLSGIGFVFTKDAGYVGIDMDGHIDQALINWFDSYAELSQSGKGVHIIIKASIPDGRKTARYEMYAHARYFVMTGNVIHDRPIASRQTEADQFYAEIFAAQDRPTPAPSTTADQGPVIDLSRFMGGICNHRLAIDDFADDPVELAKASAQGAKFSALWEGHWQGAGYESQSSADAALLSMLRFWTGGSQTESFRLFRASGLMREKWNREDYRNRTWASIDHGEVFERARTVPYKIGTPAPPEPAAQAPAMPVTAAMVEAAASPWRATTITDVLQAIEGTTLGRLVAAMRSPMRDRAGQPLPAEVGLVKALVLCGCALSGKREKPRDQGNLVTHTANGAALARVRIMTGGGQVPNVMALLVGGTASGKDVGALIDRVANAHGWLIGTAGSEEGIADAYISKPNGLLSISEFSNFVDKDHWASRAAAFLTTAFNKGWFTHTMSTRSKATPRESNYCYPNVYANVQPAVLQAKANSVDIESGFLGRFLIAQMPNDYKGEAVGDDLTPTVEACKELLAPLVAMDADIQVPWGYSFDLLDYFGDAQAKPEASWRRLAREYYPRFALMLSALPGQPMPTSIPAEAWPKAAVLVRYFFAQAEAILTNIHDDPLANRRITLENRILEIITKAGKAGATRSTISTNTGRGSTAEDRDKALKELLEKNLIRLALVDGRQAYVKQEARGA